VHNDEDGDVQIIQVKSLPEQEFNHEQEQGSFSLISIKISVRVHQLPTSISSSSIPETGPFDLVSIRPSSQPPVAGGSGPVTPRIKVPKKKEPSTSEIKRTPERNRTIEAEESFLRSTEA